VCYTREREREGEGEGERDFEKRGVDTTKVVQGRNM